MNKFLVVPYEKGSQRFPRRVSWWEGAPPQRQCQSCPYQMAGSSTSSSARSDWSAARNKKHKHTQKFLNIFTLQLRLLQSCCLTLEVRKTTGSQILDSSDCLCYFFNNFFDSYIKHILTRKCFASHPERYLAIFIEHWNVEHQTSEQLLHHRGTQVSVK